MTPAGVVTVFASGITEPTGLAFDAAGNLYVAAGVRPTVEEVTPAGAVSTFASGFHGPEFGLRRCRQPLRQQRKRQNRHGQQVSANVTVPFTMGGTAVSGTDYSGVTASPLTFEIGQTTENITGTLYDVSGAKRR